MSLFFFTFLPRRFCAAGLCTMSSRMYRGPWKISLEFNETKDSFGTNGSAQNQSEKNPNSPCCLLQLQYLVKSVDENTIEIQKSLLCCQILNIYYKTTTRNTSNNANSSKLPNPYGLRVLSHHSRLVHFNWTRVQFHGQSSELQRKWSRAQTSRGRRSWKEWSSEEEVHLKKDRTKANEGVPFHCSCPVPWTVLCSVVFSQHLFLVIYTEF